MEDNCSVCGLPMHADADAGKEICRRCYIWFEDNDLLPLVELWIEELKGEN